MTEMVTQSSDARIAMCACGAVQVTTTGRPQIINACACLDCQRRTGSSFSYTAFFPDTAVSIQGHTRTWRGMRDAGRWLEAYFCPTCGVTVFNRLEVFPGLTGVAVGSFADPTFEAPHGFYWDSRRHRWFAAPRDIKVLDQQ